jgi:FkbM family methyltransferase
MLDSDRWSGRIRRKLMDGELLSAAWRLGLRRGRKLAHRIAVADAHYWLDCERVVTKRYSASFPRPSSHHISYGNYLLDSRHRLDANSVVYSFGVGGDISFDRAIAATFGCTVHMYDPTPSSVAFFQALKARAEDPALKLLNLHPIGAWNEDTVLKFAIPLRGGDASAVANEPRAHYFEAPCQSVRTMLKENGHSSIDVLKMDIEGAAELVMDYLLDEGIFPRQVVAEFERPRGDVRKMIAYFAHLDQICSRMDAAGYDVTFIPRSRANHYGLDLLFARRSFE